MRIQTEKLPDLLKTDNLPLVAIGLCPLFLAITSTVNALVMGGLFYLILALNSIFLHCIRNLIPLTMRLPMILILLAGITTLVSILMRAFYYDWYIDLGIYLPLLAVNCLILAHAEERVLPGGAKAVLQGLGYGLIVWCILLLLGLARDVTSLFLSGTTGSLTGLAPGNFFFLGLIISLVNYLNIRVSAPPPQETAVE